MTLTNDLCVIIGIVTGNGVLPLIGQHHQNVQFHIFSGNQAVSRTPLSVTGKPVRGTGCLLWRVIATTILDGKMI